MATKHRPKAPLCQSCAMPLERPLDHGTDVGGRRDEDYCRECFHEGVFTQPNLLMDEMIARLSTMSDRLHLTVVEATELGRRLLPTLKRWRDSTP